MHEIWRVFRDRKLSIYLDVLKYTFSFETLGVGNIEIKVWGTFDLFNEFQGI